MAGKEEVVRPEAGRDCEAAEGEDAVIEQYPDETQLEKIRSWDVYRSADARELLAYVKTLWAYADWGWSERGNRYAISTGGWSGNEDLIGAMQLNFVFWSMCWESSRRGGHYRLRVPRLRPAKGGGSGE